MQSIVEECATISTIIWFFSLLIIRSASTFITILVNFSGVSKTAEAFTIDFIEKSMEKEYTHPVSTSLTVSTDATKAGNIHAHIG